MTGLICEEYLQWLNNKVQGEGRKVLLLMDNFSGHELAVQLVGGLQGLSHVRIAWLPPNTTSVWQPMDQGIIASFKLQYCDDPEPPRTANRISKLLRLGHLAKKAQY
jgi:hypothetical protein